MPDQPEDPRDYDMRIPPPATDTPGTDKPRHEHKSEEPSPDDERGKDGAIGKENSGQDDLRPESGRHAER